MRDEPVWGIDEATDLGFRVAPCRQVELVRLLRELRNPRYLPAVVQSDAHPHTERPKISGYIRCRFRHLVPLPFLAVHFGAAAILCGEIQDLQARDLIEASGNLK